MSTPKSPDPAKLVFSVFMGEKSLFDGLFDALEAIGGPVDMISRWLDFDFTDYYHREMGSPLFRRIVAFKPLVDQGDLPRIKLATNRLENIHTAGNSRQVNIDPGYLLPSRFVLADRKSVV